MITDTGSEDPHQLDWNVLVGQKHHRNSLKIGQTERREDDKGNDQTNSKNLDKHRSVS